MRKSSNHFNLATVFTVIFSLFFSITLSSMASASSITAGMSAEVAVEFKAELNKQVSLQHSPLRSWNLSMMKNPYGKFLEVIGEKLGDKTDKGFEPNYGRRLMTYGESTLDAKSSRFSECQRAINSFISLAKSAHFRATEWKDHPPTKVQTMQGYGVEYPFTQDEKGDGTYRPIQIALELGWEYQGKGEEQVDKFFSACLAIPIDLYFWEDEFDEDE